MPNVRHSSTGFETGLCSWRVGRSTHCATALLHKQWHYLHPNHGWWCHGIASSDGRISHLVYKEHLEGLQGEPAFVARQWSVAQLPQCAGVDDADVEEGPEEVFPPSLARPAYSVVGPHLVKVVDSSHRLVVAHNTCRHMQGDILVVATGGWWPHSGLNMFQRMSRRNSTTIKLQRRLLSVC